MSIACQMLHELTRGLPRFGFPFDVADIPTNGVYLLFESGEPGHGGDRIVRIGTHNGNGNLRSRLKEHFLKENKDRSIFRKNIGRALLNRDNDPFLAQWNYDLTGRESREKYRGMVDHERQRLVEKRVSKYIQTTLTFCILPVPEKNERLELEARAIATVASCPECQASDGWLGRQSPLEPIRESGLWQVQHLNGPTLTEVDLKLW